mmetsp:Transcript_4472/g.6004  ORF Transcript_4472/g.6004 Transcript_4472/m.6004 type:complete len:81 (-) Transcript_4472:792-1034(-)
MKLIAQEILTLCRSLPMLARSVYSQSCLSSAETIALSRFATNHLMERRFERDSAVKDSAVKDSAVIGLIQKFQGLSVEIG